MRIMTLTSGLAVLTLAACGQGNDGAPADKAPQAAETSAAEMPAGPMPGLWRVTTRIGGMPAGMEPPSVETCIREAKFEMPEGTPESPGMTCEQQSFLSRQSVPTLDGTSSDGVRTETDTRVSGDFSRNYTMELKSTVTPPPSPDMAEVTMVMTAERLGDCPPESATQ